MWTDFAYALVQVLHNFGAALVVGSPAAAWWLARDNFPVQVKLARLMALAWAVQAISATGFALTSFLSRGQLPEIGGVALAALGIKVICAATGFVLAAAYPVLAKNWPWEKRAILWKILFVLAATALTAAAFLRWFA